MIVIGAVALVLAALGVIAAVVMGRNVDVTLDGFGVHVTTSVLWVFAAGAVAMLLLLIALSALRRSARRRRARRKELKQLRREGVGGQETVGHRSEDDPSSERRYVPGDERAD